MCLYPAPGVRVCEEGRVRGAGGPDGDRPSRRGQDGARPRRPRRPDRACRHHQGGRGQARRRGDRRALWQAYVHQNLYIYRATTSLFRNYLLVLYRKRRVYRIHKSPFARTI